MGNTFGKAKAGASERRAFLHLGGGGDHRGDRGHTAAAPMPLFARTNTGIVLPGNWADSLLTSNSGNPAHLVLGKPLGIVLCTLLAVKWRVSQLPSEVGWQHIIGAGFLGGIGFTMSIFITLLAFDHPDPLHPGIQDKHFAQFTRGGERQVF